MALAVLATVVNDKEFRMIAVSFEPQLVPELVAAFRPETRAPVRTQICVLQCIDSLIRRRDQIAELYSSLNVSANHGVLMYVLRRAFAPSDHGRLPLPSTTTDSSVVRADSGAGMAKYPRQFLDSLQALIMSMTPWHNSSQLLVSAGAVDLLVSVLRHDSVADVTDVIRAVRLLHTIIISSPTSGFNAFASSEGVALLVKRMKLEVDRSIEEDSRALYDIDAKALPYPLAVYPLTSDTQFKAPEVLSASQITILKALFKLLHHLVQQPSYHDHLRNLIESSLPQTIEN
ncbi:E3 ubiquitin-protein ligase tom1, partial [Spiromyces aspiralis]